VNGDVLDSVEIYTNGAWITDSISFLPRYSFPMLSHMNMPVMFPGAPDQNDVSILYEDDWIVEKTFNQTFSQETAIDLKAIGLC